MSIWFSPTQVLLNVSKICQLMALRGGSVTLLAGGRWLYGVVGACTRLPEMRTCSEKESLWQNKTWVGDRGDSYLVYAVDPQRFLASSHVCQRHDLKTYQALRCQPSSHHHANSLLLTGGHRDVHTSAHLHSLSSRQKKLLTEEGARNWVASLSRSERNNLEWALQEERPSEGGR